MASRPSKNFEVYQLVEVFANRKFRLGEAGNPTLNSPLVWPLAAQNKNYTRYMTAYNEIEFKQIRSQALKTPQFLT